MMRILISLMLLAGAASAVEPIELSGSDFSDFDIFNSTDSEYVIDMHIVDMEIDLDFLEGDPADGIPINQHKPVLKMGNAGGYNRTAQFERSINGTGF